MMERILIVALLLSIVVAIRWYIGWRSRVATTQRIDPAELPAGQAGIVAFHTAHCVQCDRLQKPALQRVQQQRTDVAVTWRAVADHPQLVKTLGILTVPSTVVHDQHGRITNVNMGYTDETVLLQQLAVVSAPPHCS